MGLFTVEAGFCSKPTTTLTTTSLATTTNKPAVKDHVLMLSTRKLSNVPMVIGLDGESVCNFIVLQLGHTQIIFWILSRLCSRGIVRHPRLRDPM